MRPFEDEAGRLRLLYLLGYLRALAESWGLPGDPGRLARVVGELAEVLDLGE